MYKWIDLVNVFIGTAGSGHALVGPQMPHGMVKLGPDTITLPCGGYDYNDGRIIGFSHTHLEGVGGRGGRGNILVTAATGPLKTEEKEYASTFSHDRESAAVGYYQVVLDDYGTNVELTAAQHTGFHQYTFPEAEDAHILVDVGHTLGGWNNCSDGYIEIAGSDAVQGYGVYPITVKEKSTFTVYFYARFRKPFKSHTIWNGDVVDSDSRNTQGSKIGASLNYSTSEGEVIQVKVGISYISVEQARYNLEQEIPGWDFQKVKAGVQEAWESALSRVKVKGGSEDNRVQFYSALYRALNQPTDYTEYGRYHSGFSGRPEVYAAEGRHFYSDNWALWDTFRTTHPLQVLIEPERQNDMAETFVRIYEQGGWLPMAPAPNLGYNQTMIGHNAAGVMADIYSKGYKDFSIEKAYESMKKTAMEQHQDPSMGRLGTPELYKNLGYYPGGDEDTEEDTFSVSLTLELVYADWCTAQMAKAAGKMEEYAYFMERAHGYRRLFDPSVGFMRPRHRDGSWVEPFNPADSFKNGFCECSSWEYTFFVPHDIQGMVNLIGGWEAFVKKLDDFFAGGHFNYENETSIQVPFLYNYAGAPWRTQEVIRRYMAEKFNSKPDGLYGEDDDGAMSAWYAFSVMGLYPPCPGQEVYVFGSPVFEETVIHGENGRTFTIRACNASKENIYIQSAKLNGESYNKPWITHSDIQRGGTLSFVMGPNPNKEWGSAPDAVPPSMTIETPVLQYHDMVIKEKEIEAGKVFAVSLVVENTGAEGGETVKVYGNGKPIGSMVVFLNSGESRRVEISCTLYEEGRYTIDAGGTGGEVTLKGRRRPTFEYLKGIRLSKIVIPYGREEDISATEWVKNTGSFAGEERVKLYINGEVKEEKTVKVQPGESREVNFSFRLKEIGNYEVRIGTSTIEKIDVAGQPDERWAAMSTTRAAYYQAGEHLYIHAAGFQSRPEFGILYLKEKLEGDFTATAKVAREENTSPYAPAGIIVQNDMADMEDL